MERLTSGKPAAFKPHYLAKDYRSFRQLMLDRMAELLPEWEERNPADLGVAIVEVLAYAADYLSYYQDSVGAEAYLGTARRRISVRRHARLLDYRLHEGCNARVWVQVLLESDAAAPVVLPAGTPLLTGGETESGTVGVGSPELERALGAEALVFETVGEAKLRPEHESMCVDAPGAGGTSLLQGATTAALVGRYEYLAAGDVLIFEVNSPSRFAHAVRLVSPGRSLVDPAGGAERTEIAWHREDALPCDLPVAGTTVRGNIVLADHGRTEVLELPPLADDTGRGPAIEETADFTHRVAADPRLLRRRSARGSVEQDPREAQPAISLLEPGVEKLGREPWLPVRDLLGAGPYEHHFVAELESAGMARLRFGDGVNGRRPLPGARFLATYRVGNGPLGNVGRGAIRRVVTDDLRVLSADNPLAAAGGVAREELERARMNAPQALRRQRRCITAEDFAAAAALHPEVLAAAARLRWTGSWRTAYVHVQLPGAAPLEAELRGRIEEFLRPRVPLGHVVEIREPRWVPLEITLQITLAPGGMRHPTRRRLEARLGDGMLEDGRRAFFHPDSLSFGQPVSLGDLVAAAREVGGIEAVEVEAFRRREGSPGNEMATGEIPISPLEIAALRRDAAGAQLGALELHLRERR